MIDFNDFCDTDLKRFAKPWVADGVEYATDGRIAVRRKTTAENTSDKPTANVEFVIDEAIKNIDGEEIALPDFVPCDDCGGKVSTQGIVECDECEGDGYYDCPHCEQEMDCDECGGSGKVTEYDECKPCKERYTVILDDENDLNPKYVALLVKNGITRVWRTGHSVYFNVDGIEGLLMSRKRSMP